MSTFAQDNRTDNELVMACAEKIFGIKKIHYAEWDNERKWPQYIPSGKPWRTHSIDAKPVPNPLTSAADSEALVERVIPKEGTYILGAQRRVL